MGIIAINDISVSFGGPLLLDGATLQINAGERIGLSGRNGAGKSTLLKLIRGDIIPDRGAIIRSGNLRVAILPQEVPDDLPGTVYDVVASGSQVHLDLLQEYRTLTNQMTKVSDAGLLKKLAEIQHQLDTSGTWRYHQRVEAVMARTELDANALFQFLSAGLKRRVFLAKALVNEPNLLLLDEPTNHLDINAILWLEDFLLKYDGTIIFVTHDRAFFQKLATRIVEIDRGRLLSFACDYATYLERRQALLEAEEKQRHDFDKKMNQEETWIRRGVKARRTRDEGRVRALLQMRKERADRRDRDGSVRLVIQQAERSGKLVADVEEISFSYDDRKIVDRFSTNIIRGDRVGIIGPNGSGKTTLIKLLIGELAPQQGKIRLGARLNIAYFDQLRNKLDEDLTLKENIAGDSDQVSVGGTPRHVIGYLKDFLFSPAQIMATVKSLSGGERNRLLLAKLFSAPSNVLVLDEPTNDLDAETMELLEDRLLEYSGTVLLVSHDRAFLNNMVTSTIVFEGGGRLQEYVGGYDDWLRQRSAEAWLPQTSLKPGIKKQPRPPREKRKLSYKETHELEGLPQKIAALEKDIQILTAKLNSPDFYVKNDVLKIKAANEQLAALTKELDETYRRWDELGELAARFDR